MQIEQQHPDNFQCPFCGENPTDKAKKPVAWIHIFGDYYEPHLRELNEDEIERGWTQKPLIEA